MCMLNCKIRMGFKKYLIFGLMFSLFSACSCSELMAQNGPFDTQNNSSPTQNDPSGTQFTPIDPCTDPALPCPIDDGVYFLLAAGIGAAAYKTHRYKRVNTPSII